MSEGTPFLRVTDPRGRASRWVLVRAPVTGRGAAARLGELAAAGCRFAGITSYLGFPGDGYRDQRDYGLLCEAWFHCFREPDRYLPNAGLRVLLSESDFTDPRIVDPARLDGPAGFVNGPLGSVDVVYVGGSQRWQQEAKQWPLAARCLRVLAGAGLRCLAVDGPTDPPPPADVQTVGPLSWTHLLTTIRRARFVLVPGLLDPSPRVLAEALCLDIPVVVNRSILGGWKYVTPFTGVYFDSESDVLDAVVELNAGRQRPRSWFLARYGPVRAGRTLRDALRVLDPDLPEVSHLRLVPDGEFSSPPGLARD